MRKLLLAAGAAAMALSIPAVADPGGGKGGGKAEHGAKGGKDHGGGGHGGGKPDKGDKGGGWAKQEAKAHKQERKAEREWAKADAKADKGFRKAEAKAEKQWVKRDDRLRDRDDGFQNVRDDDFRVDGRRLGASYGEGCPPGLAKKGNGCLPPGQAKKLYALGERFPVAYYPEYNVPDEYRSWYSDYDDYSYRYDDGNIYRVNNDTGLIGGLIPLLGGAFGVGNLLPAGYDVYNLPTQYRDDYYDTDDAYYRYGDDAIYRVDPKTQMIQSVVALLAGNLNVGQALPSGYDAYNLPMQYRDQYADGDDAMYRYADGNIYEIDPKTRIIEAIVASLV